MYEKNLGSNHKNKEMGFWNGGYPMMQFKTLNENTRYNQPSQVGVSKKTEKPRKPEKKQPKKPNYKKNRLKF